MTKNSRTESSNEQLAESLKKCTGARAVTVTTIPAKDLPSAAELGAEKLLDALLVFVLDPVQGPRLAEDDPQATIQALDALEEFRAKIVDLRTLALLAERRDEALAAVANPDARRAALGSPLEAARIDATRALESGADEIEVLDMLLAVDPLLLKRHDLPGRETLVRWYQYADGDEFTADDQAEVSEIVKRLSTPKGGLS